MLKENCLRWRHFSAAPHRMLFFGGAAALVISMLWWGVVLLARNGIVPALPAHGLAPTWTHAWLMVYGIFPFFVLGFLLTAFPRWIGAPPVDRRIYQPIALGLFAGYLMVLFGAPFAAAVAALGMAVTAAAWIGGLAALALRLKAHPPKNSPHPPWAVILLALGLSGALLSAWGAASGNPWAQRSGPLLGIWGFLAPMVFVVGHRMIPFFAQAGLSGYTAFRPPWVPLAGAFLFLGHTALLLCSLPAWVWLTDLPLTMLAAWLLWHWRPWAARDVPLLWSLFTAWFWLPVALALSALQSLVLNLSGSLILGFAPLHVLTVGVLAGMVMAMATRISLGHAGRALRMDRLSIACFLVLQLTVLTRLIAEVPYRPLGMQAWLLAAVALWLLAWLPWALHYGRMYWLPRSDGQPG